jgi:hypothetical protein
MHTDLTTNVIFSNKIIDRWMKFKVLKKVLKQLIFSPRFTVSVITNKWFPQYLLESYF